MKSDKHFMINKYYIKKIVEYAKLNKKDKVLEIGTGHGELTYYIAKEVEKVYTIEKDYKLIEEAKERLKEFDNIEFINKDALKVNFSSFDVNKIVSNLPYSISSPITQKIIDFMQEKLREGKKVVAVLTYQYEFARRLTAKLGSKEYSRITIFAQSYCNVKLLKKIPKTAFRPIPKVDSAIVMLKPKECKYEKEFFKFIKTLFLNKNKKIINSFPKKEREKIKEKLKDLSEKRVRHLSIEELYKIYKILKE